MRALLREPQERTLYEAIQKVKADTVAAINVENFAGAMRALAELRAPVDAFFDKVTVNAPDAGAARQPPRPAVRDPRRHPQRRRLLQDRRLTSFPRRRESTQPAWYESSGVVDTRLRGHDGATPCGRWRSCGPPSMPSLSGCV